MRGAFRGNTARPVNPVAQPANLELDGATRATRARTVGAPCITPGHFRDLIREAAAAGRMAAEFA